MTIDLIDIKVSTVNVPGLLPCLNWLDAVTFINEYKVGQNSMYNLWLFSGMQINLKCTFLVIRILVYLCIVPIVFSKYRSFKTSSLNFPLIWMEMVFYLEIIYKFTAHGVLVWYITLVAIAIWILVNSCPSVNHILIKFRSTLHLIFH